MNFPDALTYLRQTHDQDTPTFSEAMAGPYRAEFKKTMQQEINELTNITFGLWYLEVLCQKESQLCQVSGPLR